MKGREGINRKRIKSVVNTQKKEEGQVYGQGNREGLSMEKKGRGKRIQSVKPTEGVIFKKKNYSNKKKIKAKTGEHSISESRRQPEDQKE